MNAADVAFGVKLSYDGRGGRLVGNGSAGYTIARFATEAEAVAFALRHPRSLMPNLPACVRAAQDEDIAAFMREFGGGTPAVAS